ncbi:uncharacterized protein CDAR_561421 [Caerostris darwini]|uniref:Uncharacterized protein n=1 Tax=Caerostris darwini TaxID=1538125 RepID=A0AAV4TWN6_9ARAC|nr:uncharacterized protein CDAR_561421 [Caerostris darwini]
MPPFSWIRALIQKALFSPFCMRFRKEFFFYVRVCHKGATLNNGKKLVTQPHGDTREKPHSEQRHLAAFSLWLLMNILLCTVPRYGAYTMQLTGGLMLLTNAIYTWLLPRKPLVIPFEGGALHFKYGWCFWIVLAAGVMAVIVGGAVAVVDLLFPNKFTTILEVDYDMPYRYLVSQTDPSAQKQKCSQSNSSISVQPSSTNSSNSKGFENGGYEEAEEEDYSTIVNGKRAVSLRNFGKFAQKEGLRKNPSPLSSTTQPRAENLGSPIVVREATRRSVIGVKGFPVGQEANMGKGFVSIRLFVNFAFKVQVKDWCIF